MYLFRTGYHSTSAIQLKMRVRYYSTLFSTRMTNESRNISHTKKFFNKTALRKSNLKAIKP